MKTKSQTCLVALCLQMLSMPVSSVFADDPKAVEPSEVGIPYSWEIDLHLGDQSMTPPDHVGAWSWDEDTFPETARGWTHTSKFIKLNLPENAALTITLESLAGVPWPSSNDPNRLAGTNLFPSFTLYRGWDTDAGVKLGTNGTTIDQEHTFNNRGNIEWAEDVTYLDHLENATTNSISRKWLLPAGQYTVNVGGNSPAMQAEGRQGYKALFTAEPVSVALTNAAMSVIETSEIGVPYGMGLVMNDQAFAETLPDHVGAWSWDEDTFPETARGWTHTSKFIGLLLLEPADLTLTLSSLANVSWPSSNDPNRLAGTNLYPSFTLYRGWDTDAGVKLGTNGTTIDQEHTFNNRGNIEWAEDVTYLDHLENTTQHSISKTWTLSPGKYTINVGGNSPAAQAEGRQGYRATLTTKPVPHIRMELNGNAASIRWSEKNSSFQLYEATKLDGPWSPAAGTPVKKHGFIDHSIPQASPQKFYRLQK